jgi:hypothetical protein
VLPGNTGPVAILELVRARPDWQGALELALMRPPGVPERRAGEDPWDPKPHFKRPRRISDDLAWFRRAVDDPSTYGLRPVDDEAAMPVWESDDTVVVGHLTRLRDRGVLEAAGFALHEPDRAVA